MRFSIPNLLLQLLDCFPLLNDPLLIPLQSSFQTLYVLSRKDKNYCFFIVKKALHCLTDPLRTKKMLKTSQRKAQPLRKNELLLQDFTVLLPTYRKILRQHVPNWITAVQPKPRQTQIPELLLSFTQDCGTQRILSIFQQSGYLYKNK